jgi:hypothetical protein
VPATVVEKPVSCISAAALPLALAPPEAASRPLQTGAAVREVLGTGAVEAGAV